jgi:predicted Zn-dependent protease
MRFRISIKRSMALAAGLIAGILFINVSHGQLFISEREIERQARLQWRMMKQQLPLSPSPRLQSYVECVAYRIIDVLDTQHGDLAWEIVVFDDDSINAFAMPGGKVGVFTGILRVADTPDSLAAVIGHEIAHLTENHVMERAKRQSRSEALVLLGNAATGMGDFMRMGAAIGLTLPFGRRQESEADVVGLEYMAKAGFDPRASIALWKNMSGARNSPPEFLSTHPSDDRRLDDLVKSLTPALIQFNAARESGRVPNCQP